MRTSRQTQGFALIELLLVLGIGILMMAAVWSVFAAREQDLRVQRSFEAIDRLVDIADTAYLSSPGYWVNGFTGVEVVSLQHLQALVPELPDVVIHQGGTTYTNPWGGTWAVDAVSTTSGDRDLMRISLTDLPPEACLSLVSRMAPRVYDTTVNGQLVGLTPARTVHEAGRGQIRTASVIALCDNSDNTIVFRRLKPANYTLLRDHPMNPNGLSVREQTVYLPVFRRVEQAMTDREAAQVALP